MRTLEEYNIKINRNGECFNLSSGKAIKSFVDGSGYCHIHLPITHKLMKLHRLLCMAYKKKEIRQFEQDYPNEKWICDHIDRNKLNNSLDNLRIATHSENAKNRHNNRRPVRVIITTAETQIIYEYPSIVDAQRKHGGGIRSLLDRKYKSKKGIVAEFI